MYFELCLSCIEQKQVKSQICSMNIFNAHSLIECTTYDEDKNAIILNLLSLAKMLADYFLPILMTQ